MNSFSDFGLMPSLLKTLKEKRLAKPTQIQSLAIPILMGGTSVVGISETGSGKTLAFAVPLLQMLKTLENEGQGVEANSTPRAVVMVPTRDLGEQVSKVFKTLTHDTRLRVRPALGGMTFEQCRRNIAGPFEILLATPGRMVQLIDKQLIDLTDVRMLIFDEADQMLDQGFLPDSNFIVDSCPTHPQMALFSATVSPAVQELMNTLFSGAEVIRSSGSGKVVESLTTKNVIIKDGLRWPAMERILNQRTEGGTLVFTNTREQCDKLAQDLTEKGFPCGVYRGEMDKNKRRASLKEFRDGKFDLLIATDLAGRGLDLEHVGRVINYHLPQQMENYLHRVGRTARAGRPGLVINLVTERDDRLITKLSGGKSPFAATSQGVRTTGKPTSQQGGKPTGKPAGKPAAKAGTPGKAKPHFRSASRDLRNEGSTKQDPNQETRPAKPTARTGKDRPKFEAPTKPAHKPRHPASGSSGKSRPTRSSAGGAKKR